MAGIAEEGFTAEEYFAYSRRRAPSRHARRIAAMIISSGISSVLEVGCGAGFSLAHIKSAVSNDVLCAGCDPEASMLEFAAKTHGTDITWSLNDDESIPFKDNSFEFIFSEGSLHHFRYPEKMFSEIKRILRPGGEMLVMDINPDSMFSIAYRIFVRIKSVAGLSNTGERALVMSMQKALKEHHVVDIMKRCGINGKTEKSLAALYYKWHKPNGEVHK